MAIDGMFPGLPWKMDYSSEQLAQAVENQVPKIGENGHWMVWNISTGAWEDTGVEATGPSGSGGLTEEEADSRYVLKGIVPDATPQQIYGGLVALNAGQNQLGVVLDGMGLFSMEGGNGIMVVSQHGKGIGILAQNSGDPTGSSPGSWVQIVGQGGVTLMAGPSNAMATFNLQATALFLSGPTPGGLLVSGVKDPMGDSDAANKKYVDDHAGLTEADADTRYLKLTGGRITQPGATGQENSLSLSGGEIDIHGTTGIIAHLLPDKISFANGARSISLSAIAPYWLTNEMILSLGSAYLGGLKTVPQESAKTSQYQKLAATVEFVNASIAAAIGNINSVLDAINGEVV